MRPCVSMSLRSPARAVMPFLRSALLPAGLLVGLVGLVLVSSSADAGELSSASYRHRAGTFSSSTAAGTSALVSAAIDPAFGSAETSVGGAPSVAPVGSLGTLSSLLPGFWPIVLGALPTLDLDGDLAQFFLDEDDDGDGLDDVHETGTGFFVSATNTGTSPTRVDSDGDGFADGVEVAAGTDPTDRFSTPTGTPAVPGLSMPWSLALLVLLCGVAVLAHGSVRRKQTC